MMKKAQHLLIVISLLHNVHHFVNATENIIWYMQHPNSSKMHKKKDVVRVEAGKPSLTSEILHYYPHHGCIYIKKMIKREDGLVMIFIPRFKVWFKITHV